MISIRLSKSLAACSLTAALLATSAITTMVGSTSVAIAAPVKVEGVKQPGFADLVEQIKPTVVSVQVKGSPQRARGSKFSQFFDGPGFDNLPDNHPLKRFFKDFDKQFEEPSTGGKNHIRPVAQGSGFVISEDGYVVTNNHVLSDGSAYSVILDDGSEFEAKLIGADPRTDLAVLKIEAKQKFSYVAFADDSKMRIGDWVVAVGNPFGLGGSVTAGIISARGRDIGTSAYDDFIQIDAAVNQGNSGGPTFNLNGEVVGINTAIFSPSGGSVGIAFAIPASTAKEVVDQLIKTGSVERGWIGVQIQPVTKEIAESLGLEEAKGAIVADPMDGPASDAGIKAGDTILKINNISVNDARDLARKIGAIQPGQTANLTIWRHGKMMDIKVKIATMPDDVNKLPNNIGGPQRELDQFGLTLTPNDNGPGVVVTRIDPDGDAAYNGIRPGDIVMSVNNHRVSKVDDIAEVIKNAKKEGRGSVLMQLKSNDQNRFVTLPIKD